MINKYIKYKHKYLNLKKMTGSGGVFSSCIGNECGENNEVENNEVENNDLDENYDGITFDNLEDNINSEKNNYTELPIEKRIIYEEAMKKFDIGYNTKKILICSIKFTNKKSNNSINIYSNNFKVKRTGKPENELDSGWGINSSSKIKYDDELKNIMIRMIKPINIDNYVNKIIKLEDFCRWNSINFNTFRNALYLDKGITAQEFDLFTSTLVKKINIGRNSKKIFDESVKGKGTTGNYIFNNPSCDGCYQETSGWIIKNNMNILLYNSKIFVPLTRGQNSEYYQYIELSSLCADNSIDYFNLYEAFCNDNVEKTASQINDSL